MRKFILTGTLGIYESNSQTNKEFHVTHIAQSLQFFFKKL